MNRLIVYNRNRGKQQDNFSEVFSQKYKIQAEITIIVFS